MLNRFVQRLTDHVFYRKRWRSLARLFHRERPVAANLLSADHLAYCRRVYLVVSHPDDETFCSGLLCQLAGQGADIRVLCLTRGEGGPACGVDRAKLDEIRSLEMEEACAVLGIREVQFLDYTDPPAWKFRTFAPRVGVSDLSDHLLTCLSAFEPCLIITHGSAGEYWHPAHFLTHRATLRAAARLRRRLGRTVVVATANAWQPDHPLPHILNRDDPPHLRHRATPQQTLLRLRALRVHESQRSVFEEFTGGTIGDFIDRTTVENYRLRIFRAAGETRLPFENAAQPKSGRLRPAPSCSD